MRAAKGGAVARVRGGEGGAILEGGETNASADGHGDGDAPYHNFDASRVNLVGINASALMRFCGRAENPLECSQYLK